MPKALKSSFVPDSIPPADSSVHPNAKLSRLDSLTFSFT